MKRPRSSCMGLDVKRGRADFLTDAASGSTICLDACPTVLLYTWCDGLGMIRGRDDGREPGRSAAKSAMPSLTHGALVSLAALPSPPLFPSVNPLTLVCPSACSFALSSAVLPLLTKTLDWRALVAHQRQLSPTVVPPYTGYLIDC